MCNNEFCGAIHELYVSKAVDLKSFPKNIHENIFDAFPFYYLMV